MTLQVITAGLGLAVVAAVLFTLGLWASWADPDLWSGWAVVCAGVSAGFLLVSRWLVHRGQRVGGARLAVVGLHVVVVVAVAYYGGTRTVAAAYLPALVALSGLLLGGRAAAVSLVACLLFLGVDHVMGPLGPVVTVLPGERLMDWCLGTGMAGLLYLLAMRHNDQLVEGVVEHSEREAQAQAGREQAERFRGEVLARSPSPTLLVGPDGRIMELNEAASHLVGQALGDQVSEVLAWTVGDEEGRVVSADPPVPVRVREAPVTDPRGRPCTILAFQDLRPQRAAVAQQREALLHAEAANRAKSSFLEAISHELRTPLNAILGYGEMLEEDLADADHRQDVGRILTSGRHLLRLIDDVLDLSHVESGHLDIASEVVPMRQLLGEVEAMVRPMLRRKGHQLRVDSLPDATCAVWGDGRRLRQVLVNLVGNAVKYTDGGVISITVEQRDDLLRIEVIDDGAGIDEGLLPVLFEPFRRGDHPGVEGRGLGLALSRTLVAGMGGALTADNHPGRGARFVAELPAATADATASAS